MKSTAILILMLLIGLQVSAQEEIYTNDKPQTSEVRNESPQTKKTTDTEEETTEEEIQKKFDPSKLRIGGNFGLQFGNFTFVNLSPTVGYLYLKDRLQSGAGPIFIYQNIRYSSSYRVSTFVYGVDLYTRGYIWKGLFAQAQYDFVNKESYFTNGRVNVHHLLLGGGYSTPIGNVGNFFVTALFNVINNDESIYQGTFGDFPLIMNVGFGFGIPNRR